MLPTLLANVHFSDPSSVLTVLAWIAGSFLIPLFAARILSSLSPGRSPDERQAGAMLMVVCGFFGLIAFGVSFIMLFIGYAEIPALIGIGLWGFGIGAASKS